MAFRKKSMILNKFQPDIAIIQECESKEVLKEKSSNIGFEKYIWVGKNKNKGLGVMAFNGFDIELLDHNEEFKYILPIRVYKGVVELFLLAVWTQMVNDDLRESYVVQAARALVHYRGLLEKENIMVIGDFNSNAIWDNEAGKEYNHTDMVQILSKNNL